MIVWGSINDCFRKGIKQAEKSPAMSMKEAIENLRNL